ncbi:MAG: MBL fold metallo-hydrolase, partial [bacterium]
GVVPADPYHPAVPLFDSGDAKRALLLFEPVDFKKEIKYGSVTASFHANGHILGSAFIDLVVDGKHILFSGDLGRPHDLLMRPPDAPAYCDYLVLESTYGDRTHFSGDIKERLKDIVRETISRGGSVLIPAFAVGRSQAVLHVLHELRKERSIPHTPVYLDSPMAIQATEIFYKHHTLHKLSLSECQNMFSNIHFLKTVEQSMALNHVEGPSIIISASGMATGGRVLYHLKRMLDSDRNTIVFPGYQASGTRGARLVAGEQSVKIQGQFYPVEADIENLDFISAHADRDEIFHWLRKIPAAPKKCFITHGEKQASRALEQAIEEQMGWPASTPGLEDSVEI